MKSYLVILALFTAISSHAGEGEHLALYGRSYTNSCSYYSNTSGDYRVVFQSVKLPWGTKVSLIYGWKGYNALGAGNNQNFDWAYQSEMPMRATAGWTWQADLTSVGLHSRSSNQFLTGLQFVLKLEVPGQAIRYVKGSSTPQAYLMAPALLYGSPCVDASHPLPEFRQVDFHIVER